MIGGLDKAARYRAILWRDRKYDGIFYFAVKTGNSYCRPSCPVPRPLHGDYSFYDTTEEAKAHGYRQCKRCHPDRLRNGLSPQILDSIEAGAINDVGVHGLADSLHISERHLRRIVHDRTGMSPVHLNRAKRLNTAKRLIVQTKLPIIDIAFNAEFSSLRQFNDVFRGAFNTSPREMRKLAFALRQKTAGPVVLPLVLSYKALLRTPLSHQITNQ